MNKHKSISQYLHQTSHIYTLYFDITYKFNIFCYRKISTPESFPRKYLMQKIHQGIFSHFCEGQTRQLVTLGLDSFISKHDENLILKKRTNYTPCHKNIPQTVPRRRQTLLISILESKAFLQSLPQLNTDSST